MAGQDEQGLAYSFFVFLEIVAHRLLRSMVHSLMVAEVLFVLYGQDVQDLFHQLEQQTNNETLYTN
ncbi:MAG: hypothetical protein EBR82_29830 [Caulobacteraceae bacterium]|nr:hypothetical protein [Caulobacteraceae bacterium]